MIDSESLGHGAERVLHVVRKSRSGPCRKIGPCRRGCSSVGATLMIFLVSTGGSSTSLDVFFSGVGLSLPMSEVPGQERAELLERIEASGLSRCNVLYVASDVFWILRSGELDDEGPL